MKIRTIKWLYLLLVLNLACSGSSKPDPLLEEAFLLHQQSLEIAEESREMIGKLSDKNEQVNRLETRLNNWNESLIEVPGFEHEHEHDHHDHDHDHGPQLDLTPEMMLDVQTELLDSVRAIKDELLLILKGH